MGKLLSIEIGELEMKVCVLRQKGKSKGVVLKSFTMEIPKGAVTATELFEIDTIGYELRQTLKRHKIRAKECIVTINSTQVYGRYITVPKQKNDSQTLAILKAKAETESIFPITLEGSVLSYLKLGTEMVSFEEEEIEDETNTKKVKKKKKVNKVEMQRLLAYMAPESLVKSVIELTKFAKLQLIGIEYSGNAVCQYINAKEKSGSYVVVHINDTNAIFSAVEDRVIYYQRHTDYGFKSFTRNIVEEHDKFGVDTIQDALDLIEDTNFLDKENHTMLDALADALVPVNEDDVNHIQSMLIDEVLSFFDSVQSFITQCRTNGNNPTKIILVNEREGFTDIVESLEYTVSLSVEVFSMSSYIRNVSDNKFLVPLSALVNPINFNIAENAKVKRDRAIRRIIFFEGIVAIWIGVLYVGYSYIQYQSAETVNEEYRLKIQEASEAQAIYQNYMLSEINKEKVVEFEDRATTVLNDLDKIIERLEDALPQDRVMMEALAGSETSISFSVQCDSKDTVVKLIQELEKIEYFAEVQYNGVSEAESDEFATGRSVTISLTCILQEYDENAIIEQEEPVNE